MPDKLYLAFAGIQYYNNSPGDLAGSSHDLEAATGIAKSQYERLSALNGASYCWYCVVAVDLRTHRHETVLDSRD